MRTSRGDSMIVKFHVSPLNSEKYQKNLNFKNFEVHGEIVPII